MQTDRIAMQNLERALRVADQMCSGYAILRDRYLWKAKVIDLMILAVSTWLVGMTFVEPVIGNKLTPPGIQKEIWIGCLSLGVFWLSLVQGRVDWKSKADSYQKSLNACSEFVRKNRKYQGDDNASMETIEVALAEYHNIGQWIESIPEKDFLALKKHHKLKIEISKHIDNNPGANLLLLRARIFWRDNVNLANNKTVINQICPEEESDV